ncbi:MAG: ABC transporter ATP-binding protein [Bdellovibrionota bacterium]
MILEARHLTKTFGACTAVSDVTMRFTPGKIYAVLGENGAGKSTLIRLLFGLHQPTSGEVAIDGAKVSFSSSLDAIERGIGMVQQHFSLVEPLSAIDNIMLGAEVTSGPGILDRKAAIAKLEALLPSASLAVPWETPVADLTVGQKQKVEILKLLFRDSKILFLDEPTAVLTPLEIEELFFVLRKLREQGRTIVLVTHKLGEVMQVCDEFYVLRQNSLVGSGSINETNVDGIVELMIGRKLPPFDLARPPSKTTIALRVSELREDSVKRGRLDGISLEVRAGEIVGIAGVEGSGQSHLVEAIMGLRDYSGRVDILGRETAPFQTSIVRDLGVGLVPEDRHEQALWLDETSAHNMMIGLEDRFLRHHVFDEKAIDEKTGEWSKAYDVRFSSLGATAGSLSGGNQQKLIFAREVAGREPKLLICHQPTRGVDLGAIDLIHRKIVGLRNEGLAVLLLSSELDELMKLSDRIIVFFEGRVSAEFARAEFDRLAIGKAMTTAGVRA